MLKSHVQHNYFQKQLNILAPIYKQTGQFVGTFYAGNIILQHIEMYTPTPGILSSWYAFAIIPTVCTLLGARNVKLSQKPTNVVITYIWS